MVGSAVAKDMKEAVMTDPRDFDYVRRGEALGGATWGWMLGLGTAVVIGLLIVLSFSNPTDTPSNTSASNTSPTATSNAPPRIPPSTTGSGAQPEQPAQSKPGG
jgi:hypothetical protein